MNSTRHHLAETIAKRTMEISDTHKLAQEIAAYLLHEGKVYELESLMRDVIAYRAEQGVVEAYAESAYPLSPQVIDDIRDILKKEYPHAKQFQVDQIEQPELIGGLKVELPDEQLDLSVRARVNTFKKLTSGKEA